VKHDVSELQPAIATITALNRTVEKITTTITQGDFHPKPYSFLLSGKVQAACTGLRAPVKSDKHLQLLKREGRTCACLRMNHVVSSRDKVESTQV